MKMSGRTIVKILTEGLRSERMTSDHSLHRLNSKSANSKSAHSKSANSKFVKLESERNRPVKMMFGKLW